jgi:hypothetical protein
MDCLSELEYEMGPCRRCNRDVRWNLAGEAEWPHVGFGGGHHECPACGHGVDCRDVELGPYACPACGFRPWYEEEKCYEDCGGVVTNRYLVPMLIGAELWGD